MAQIVIRPGRASDRSFLLDSMRRTLTHSSAYARGIHPDVLTQLLEPLLAHYTTLVAAAPGSDDEILGYLVHEGERAVAFVYVREGFRRGGIGRALFDRAGITKGEVSCPLMVTKHDAGNFARFAESKGYVCRFRPWLPLQLTAETMNPKEAA